MHLQQDCGVEVSGYALDTPTIVDAHRLSSREPDARFPPPAAAPPGPVSTSTHSPPFRTCGVPWPERYPAHSSGWEPLRMTPEGPHPATHRSRRSAGTGSADITLQRPAALGVESPAANWSSPMPYVCARAARQVLHPHSTGPASTPHGRGWERQPPRASYRSDSPRCSMFSLPRRPDVADSTAARGSSPHRPPHPPNLPSLGVWKDRLRRRGKHRSVLIPFESCPAQRQNCRTSRSAITASPRPTSSPLRPRD